jgi:voltage-gated potassium channel
MWYTMETLTTVGYGEMYPVSNMGKTVGSFAVISSILVLGFPISIVGKILN